MTAPENPQAFPCEQHETQDETWNQTFEGGMTLRDWFAGQAMMGFLADGSQRLVAEAIDEDAPFGMFQDPSARASVVNQQLAIGFYQLADAMLRERLK